jgi:large subunit ribosomal protein L4
MEVSVIDILTNNEVAKKSINDVLHKTEIRKDIIKKVILWQLNKARSGNHKVKTISEISGTTAKPFKQKGTGNARQGSKRSTQQRGGQTVFGPVVRSHATKLPKKVRKLGLASSISYHFKNKSIAVFQEPKMKTPNLKKLLKLDGVGKTKVLFITSEEVDSNFILSVRNIKNVKFLKSAGANVYDIVNHNKIYISDIAVDNIIKRLSNEK